MKGSTWIWRRRDWQTFSCLRNIQRVMGHNFMYYWNTKWYIRFLIRRNMGINSWGIICLFCIYLFINNIFFNMSTNSCSISIMGSSVVIRRSMHSIFGNNSIFINTIVNRELTWGGIGTSKALKDPMPSKFSFSAYFLIAFYGKGANFFTTVNFFHNLFRN